MKIGVAMSDETKVIQGLHKRLTDAQKTTPDVLVGYNSDHAFEVHENMELFPPGMRMLGLPRASGHGMYWDPHGRPKFLEGPARENHDQYVRIIINGIKAGKGVAASMFEAAEQLMRDSQDRVPVDEGDLRDSAYVRYDFSNFGMM